MLLIWDTTHDQAVVGKWGLYCAAAAAAWTVIIGMHRANRDSLDHFERRMRRVLQEQQVADLDAARY